MTLGVCFNENCSFAHGIEELREIDRVPPAVWAGASLQAGGAFLALSWLQPLSATLPFSDVTFFFLFALFASVRMVFVHWQRHRQSRLLDIFPPFHLVSKPCAGPG